jgi:DNA-binding winged helix-turn-helix (wHTH) protein/predicted esterase
MPDSSSVPRVVCFGAFELDVRSGELRKSGMRLNLPEQPFQVLTTLLEHPGDLVTRDELRQRLWPSDTFVDFEHGLNAAVKRLRDVLGDSADAPRFVETLPRRGYRFVAPVTKDGASIPEVVQSVHEQGDASVVEVHLAASPVETAPARSRLTKPVAAVVAGSLLLSGLAVAGLLVRNSQVKWARTVALPQIEALVGRAQSDPAFILLRQVDAIIPDDPEFLRLQNDVTDPATVDTKPSGASVSSKSYLNHAGDWLPLGTTPVKGMLVPFGYRRWRLVKDGYEPREVAGGSQLPTLTLKRIGEAPAGMVAVVGEGAPSETAPRPMEDFWLDKYEVTNREFKRFVDAGGYTTEVYWKHPFVKDGHTLAWVEGMSHLRDATGRPGPAGWELSSYAEGQGDLPVTGVSWYEAAAYAVYAGKSLPTYYHWRRAAAMGIYSDVLLLSNFSGKGLAKVGQHQGLGAFGTFDMAGNAKEWCFNASGSRRFILGGAWNEPSYMFMDADAQDPFKRDSTFGFRCAKYAGALSPAFTAPVMPSTRNYSKEPRVSDEVFSVYRNLYLYDRTALNATVEHLPDDSRYWRRERVTIDASYNKERLPGYLFLPTNATPPFQTVVFFPPGNAFSTRSNAYLETRQIQFLLQSGRAVLFPIYCGTFDRWREVETPRQDRDDTIRDVQDFQRSVDYLETRTDIDRGRLAYYGISTGAELAPLVLAADHRIKVAVLLGGGFEPRAVLPEVDPINFASRVHVPVLMLNGEFDFLLPVETAQRPMFELFGAQPQDKRYVTFATGHAVVTVQPMIKEILDWLDKYLGPVGLKPQ